MNDIGQVIRRQRVALRWTQEQLAEALHVTAPAVNKWERGVTCPDVALLPRLARTLKTDVNTLLGFQTSLDAEEIGARQRALVELAQKKGMAEAFAYAQEELRCWPHCERLLYSLTLVLHGQLMYAELPPEEAAVYQARIDTLLERAACAEQEEIRHSAEWMLTSRYLSRGEMARAQEVLERMPDHPAQDKRMMQINLLMAQERYEEAAQLLARTLLITASEVQIQLGKLMQVEERLGSRGRVEAIAEKASAAMAALDMNAYCQAMPKLEVAALHRDAPGAVQQLKIMLEALAAPTGLRDSPLYAHLAESQQTKASGSMLPAVLQELRQSEEYAFLRGDEAFEQLMQRWEASGSGKADKAR